MVGSIIGTIHPGSITKSCVMAQRFLRFKVDIDLSNPLLARFFHEKEDGKEIWIQFKFERMGDFCYRCGLICHVSGKCLFETPATISTSDGITAKLYGPWLKAENPGSLQFVTPGEEEDHQNRFSKIRKEFERDFNLHTSNTPLVKEGGSLRERGA